MTGYYDLVLGLIPLVLFGVSGTLSLAGVTLTSAATVAAAVGLLIVGHALFVNEPVAPESNVPTGAADETPQSSTVGPVNAD
ncbi:hypothetical protein SAMN06269185_0415 [Natronoarchaeum philippinense]|uniref:Uncharacterized protein n=1 Tax=Natronoarchaeum philippinense TaxID=558529 RepID=A0A285N3S2_NATPI|nr:hypothetical protein [Natronoarchaeum philippinense]SNZ03968.1 hypothetical protein SAMN06269185_0415 [Natronoarchaeum philippinense]